MDIDIADTSTTTTTTPPSPPPPLLSAYLTHLQELSLLHANDPRYSNLPRSDALTFFSRTLQPSSSPALNSAMLLYSRLTTRAGPYFTCDQFILRYYTSPYSFTPSYPSPSSAFPPLTALQNDLATLLSLNLIRRPASETEYALVCGNTKATGGILTAPDVNKILAHLGTAKTSKSNTVRATKTTNQILHTMTNQKTLTGVPITISNTVLNILQSSLIANCHALPPQVSKATLKTLMSLPTLPTPPILLFRLTEAPLHDLRRVLRVHLIATAGVGQMRESPWLSVLQTRLKPSLTTPAPPKLTASWNTVNYPGLQQLLNLHSYDFGAHYHPGKTPLFPTPLLLSRWEASVELRAFYDEYLAIGEFKKQLERDLSRNPPTSDKAAHKSASRRAPSPSQGYARYVDEDNNVEVEPEDALGLSSAAGRKTVVRLLLRDRAAEARVVADLESKLTEFTSNDNFESTAERLQIIITLIAYYGLVHSTDRSALPPPPHRRHLSALSVLATLSFDGVDLLERRGRHAIAAEVLQSVVGSASPADFKLMQALVSRRCRGKCWERLIIDLNKVGNESPAVAQLLDMALDGKNDGHIPFCFIRLLAKRAKKDLGDIFTFASPNKEAATLGLRMDWVPVLDTTTANSLEKAENMGKAHFIGYDDSVQHRSLSVERLAIEEYNRGNLPQNVALLDGGGGGWRGFHDEGGHVRSLFRILLNNLLLPVNPDDHTYLSPHQETHAQLHTAPEFYASSPISLSIQGLLKELSSKITPALLAAYLHPHILAADPARVRTLTLVACGMGGPGLAACVRALCYDYRHFSAGLPDLMMVRGVYKDTGEIVDLSDWIEEGFSLEREKEGEARKAAMMLGNFDGNFLGIADSRKGNKQRRGPVNPNCGSSAPLAAASAAASVPLGKNAPLSSPPSKKSAKTSSQTFLISKGNNLPRVYNGSISCELPKPFRVGPKETAHDTVVVYFHNENDSVLSSSAVAGAGPLRIVAFDFDDTLVAGRDGTQLKFAHAGEALKRIGKEPGTVLAVVSNESLEKFRKNDALSRAIEKKCARIKTFCDEVSVPMICLVPVRKDDNRKGNGAGCFELLVLMCKDQKYDVDVSRSVYVGDASGEGQAGSMGSMDTDKR